MNIIEVKADGKCTIRQSVVMPKTCIVMDKEIIKDRIEKWNELEKSYARYDTKNRMHAKQAIQKLQRIYVCL